MKEYLQDKDFLKRLDYNREKETYVRIIALSNDELPREEIVGRATGGSINVDGASAVRRTCSLSLVVLEDDEIITDAYWCYNNKFKLEIGLKNNIDKKYPDIIWFDMGIYIITNFSKSKTTNNLTVSISGKDKMCRLNGEVSGNIMYGTNFGSIDNVNKVEKEDGTVEYQTKKEKLTIKEIIENAVKEYGQENAHNIIINDLDQYGYELWEYQGDTPIYMFIKQNDNNMEVINMTMDESTKVSVNDSLDTFITNIDQYYSMNAIDPSYNTGATQITDFCGTVYVAKIEFGQTVGYHQTPLVYNNDLILNAGETVTSLLDKLKAMLGEYEYFYDLQGRFVFQKKKTYTQELFSPINGELITPTMYASQYSYKFEDESLFTSINSTPNINNVKNDFSVWGARKSSTDQELPIHARFAIDKKPQSYITPYNKYKSASSKLIYIKTINAEVINEEDFEEKKQRYKGLYYTVVNSGTYLALANNYSDTQTTLYYIEKDKNYIANGLYEECEDNPNNYKYQKKDPTDYYYKNQNNQYIKITSGQNVPLPYYDVDVPEDTEYNVSNYDWRELIYQMALDYFAHNQEPDFLLKLQQYNPQFIDGKTGYEQYYTDLQGFWRQLYNPLETQADIDFAQDNGTETITGLVESGNNIYKLVRTPIPNSLNITYVNDNNETQQRIIDIDYTFNSDTNEITSINLENGDKISYIYTVYEYYDSSADKPYWNKLLHIDPTQFNFWFDFLDTDGDLSKYSVKKYENNKYTTNIGTRTKVVNDTAVKSIYNRETPNVLFSIPEKGDEPQVDASFNYTRIQIQADMEPLFYRSAQGNSAIKRINELINTNTAISESVSITSIPIYYLQPNTRIYVAGQGDYTLDKISYSLVYNGTMNISGNKIIKPIY